MKNRVFDIAVPLCALIVAIIISIAMIFGIKKPTEPNRITMKNSDDIEVNDVCISDLQKINQIKYAYYTPNEFVSPTGKSIYAFETDITQQKNIAKKGSYQFVFYNINPDDAESFKNDSDRLSPYLGSDKHWHFTLYLPPCFTAAYVYINSELVAEVGKIEDYNYISYSDKEGYSETHSNATKPVVLDLIFYSRRAAMVNSFEQRAKIITIHYESAGKRAGLYGVPMIGSQKSIEDLLLYDRVLLIAISVAAALVFAILVFACFLKKSPFAIPQTILAFSVAGFALLRSFTYFETKTPLLVTTCVHVFAGLIIAASVLSLVYAIKRRKREFLVAPPIAVVLLVDYLIVSLDTPVFSNPVIWLAVLILLSTAFTAFKFFASLEKSNVYLTNNLKSEVARQTTDLKNIINERDKLLRYLSHDMKKPVSSIKSFVAEIRKNETNDENNKALDIIDGKLDALQSDFVELQKFAKMNFTAEPSETLYIDDFLKNTFDRLSPDCDANGITLKYFAPKIAIYAKSNILSSVLDNLVFNAIEHSKCSNITISATKNNGTCKVTVTDDGIGIQSEREVFLPYYSLNTDGENLGLGLYICRQHMLSMGGELVYSRVDDKTVFTLTLNLA